MKANPLEAAFASGVSFIAGGILPVLVVLFTSNEYLEYLLYAFSILFLALLGGLSAKTGGAIVWKAVLRISFWGTVAMGLSSLIGYFFGVNI